MTPLRVPPDTPGFDEYGQTVQPSGIAGWLALLVKIVKAWLRRK